MIKTNRPPLPLAGEGWGEGGTRQIPLTFILSPLRLCRKRGKVKNAMLNLFQHLKESNTYETLK